MNTFTITPKGPFNLLHQNQFFGGWTVSPENDKAIVMAFPIEGWKDSAVVVLEQYDQGTILGNVYGTETQQIEAWEQAIATLSLDVDGTEWPTVGKNDHIIKALQEKYTYLRPILFHSPYESAVSFLIGHRISIKQARAIRQRMAEAYGEKIMLNDTPFYAFPKPQQLLTINSFPGVSSEKIKRLHAVAQAALDGILIRDYLRSLTIDDALSKVDDLPGIGPFFAQGIVFRGAGIVDDLTTDENTLEAFQKAYDLPTKPTPQKIHTIAEAWRPYRMWAQVLLHVWMRREMGGFGKTLYKPRR